MRLTAWSALLWFLVDGGPLLTAYRPTVLPSYRLQADTTITVHANSSTLEFDPPSIAVKQGTRLRLRFVNAGTLPHNVVIVRNEDDIDSLAAVASRAGKDFVPHALETRLIAWTPLASPGQTVEVTFVVPPPGVYTYVCLMTGHTNSMMGTLRSLR